jgi:DNA/RNA-binding protein KIN17
LNFHFQEHLETVVPQEGREVVILSGKHKGELATLRAVHTDSFSATLKLDSGDKIQLPYEQFSKRHVD